ncbi:LemA family protein [Pedomonas mirosovicensis]|uniref:LemA family protein n=1 Tax=Pedomonas mirosovicensis TaxID=2908641 RepID=UPI002167A1B0|nr:LemA family protein [Pedomonas mirosovicensis]MCH8685594.1 LemA family protein [Pedomonas mirosovicensis]
MKKLRLGVVLGGALLLAGCGINDVPTKGEAASAAWAEVQNQYQRRADLVPNLVETVRGYAKHEEGTLTQVMEARAKATSVTLNADDVTDPQKVAAFEQAQAELSRGLGRLLAVAENYPDLKANQNFLALQSQLEGTENRIAVARRDYIQAVQTYNLEFRKIPDKWVTSVFHGEAEPMTPFQANQEAQTAPKVSFQ